MLNRLQTQQTGLILRWSRERNQLRYYVVSVVVFSNFPIVKAEQLAKV